MNPRYLYPAAALVACAVYWWAVGAAFAHGDAAWIMQEPRYVDRNGIHCCGPSDCGPVPDSEITEDNDTISHGGQTLQKRDRGSYWSIDEKYWVCRRYDGLKCIFRPQPGS